MRDQFTNFTTSAATTLAENIDSVGERTLDAVIDVNRKLVEFVVTTADRVGEQIPFELPFADRLPTFPTAAEGGDRYLDFVERAVAVNRDFNDRIVAMLKDDAPAAAAAATATSAATAATTTVKATAEKIAASATATKTPAVKKTATRKPAARKTAAKKTVAKTTAAKPATK